MRKKNLNYLKKTTTLFPPPQKKQFPLEWFLLRNRQFLTQSFQSPNTYDNVVLMRQKD